MPGRLRREPPRRGDEIRFGAPASGPPACPGRHYSGGCLRHRRVLVGHESSRSRLKWSSSGPAACTLMPGAAEARLDDRAKDRPPPPSDLGESCGMTRQKLGLPTSREQLPAAAKLRCVLYRARVREMTCEGSRRRLDGHVQRGVVWMRALRARGWTILPHRERLAPGAPVRRWGPGGRLRGHRGGRRRTARPRRGRWSPWSPRLRRPARCGPAFGRGVRWPVIAPRSTKEGRMPSGRRLR